MNFINSPVFNLIGFGFVTILINLQPYLFETESTPYRKIWTPILATIFFIYYFVVMPWAMTDQFFMIFVAVFAFSYVHFCFAVKKRIRTVLYAAIFIVLSLFFTVWTTVMFGKYYFDNSLIDLSGYELQYETIIKENDWFPIMDLKLSMMYFNISFKNYFILPDNLSLKDPFFVQFSLGIIISGTIVSWVVDTIKHFVTPTESN